MAGLTLRMTGDKELKTLLKKMSSKAKNLAPPLKSIKMGLIASIDKNFKAGGRPEKWKPLSPGTIAKRKKEGKGAKILQDTGTLKQSITGFSDKRTAKAGTNIKYAGIHQKGGIIRIPAMVIRPKKASALHFFIGGKEIFCKSARLPERNVRIPARPFALIQDEDTKNFKLLILKHLRAK